MNTVMSYVNDRMTENFFASSPEERRATSGIVQRWTQMVSSYTFIKDWEATRIPGSTRQGPWFQLSPARQKEYLLDKKIVLISTLSNYQVLINRFQMLFMMHWTYISRGSNSKSFKSLVYRKSQSLA